MTGELRNNTKTLDHIWRAFFLTDTPALSSIGMMTIIHASSLICGLCNNIIH